VCNDTILDLDERRGVIVAVVGVDGCKDGWIAVVLRGEEVSAFFLERIDLIGDVVADAQVIAIDIPIGLLSHGLRRADVEGRKELGRRQSTLYVVPAREALEAPTHEEATRLSTLKSGVGISRQSFSLKSKIFEVERWLDDAPCPVYEVHPELSFKQMTGSVVNSSKKTWAGMTMRRHALLREGIDLDAVSRDVSERAAVDDMLDAGAAAWSAKRLREGTARSIPQEPELSPRGREIAIWV
jgi:predicted RNase H-like nuclease